MSTAVSTLVRPLSESALSGVVSSIASRPEQWRPLVAPTEDGRVARLLSRDDELEVWVISWGPGHDTGLHDHGPSSAAFIVVEGALAEQRLIGDRRVAAPAIVRRDDAAVRVAPGVAHRVIHAGRGPAVSLHAYSPPLDELGVYRLDQDRVIERVLQSSEEMLEPLDHIDGPSRGERVAS